MPKHKEKDKNNLLGRPTSFKDEYIDLAYNYCLLGATDKDLAHFFEVSESTINNWKKHYPTFSESLKKGKQLADAQVASSLFNKAKGTIIYKQKAFKVKTSSIVDGKKVDVESIEVVDLKQEQPPDTTAAIFWLKNRNPQNWRDKTETDNQTTIKATFAISKIDTDKEEFASNESDVE